MEDFDTFWKAYPRKVAKLAAEKAWKKLSKADKEEAIKAELASEGKPEKIWANIIPGKLSRFIADNTTLDKELALLDQNYVMDDSMTVFEALNKEAAKHGGTAEIVEFVKYEVGEGIEKVVSDFAAEVAAQMG